MISHDSAYYIIREVLQYRTVSARWVQKQLILDLKERCVMFAKLFKDVLKLREVEFYDEFGR